MKAVSLVSSGIDSPVATYIMLKKKYEILPLHFSVNSALEVLKIMKKIGLNKLQYVDFKYAQEQLGKCDQRYRCVLCKRMMYRIAEKLLCKEGYDVLVTGENLAQVASQTLHNMHAISQAIKIDVIRPLLCFDKKEIIDIARKIGTYELSVKYNYDCGYVPKNPITKANISNVCKEEAKIDVEKLVEISMCKLSVIE
jgi:tRNA uracil 4-sulfurtransferase